MQAVDNILFAPWKPMMYGFQHASIGTTINMCYMCPLAETCARQRKDPHNCCDIGECSRGDFPDGSTATWHEWRKRNEHT